MSEAPSRSSPNFLSLTIALSLLLFVCNVATPTSALLPDEHQYLYQCCVTQVIFRHTNDIVDPQTKQSIAKCTDKLCSDHQQDVLTIRKTEDALNKLEAANPRAGRERVAAKALLPKNVDPVKSKFFVSLFTILGWNEATVQKLRTVLSQYPDQQALAKATANAPNYIKTLVRQHNQLQPQHQPQGSQSNQLQPQPQPQPQRQPQSQPQPQPQPQGQPQGQAQGQPQPQGSQQNQFPVQHQEQGQPPKPPSKRIKTGGEKRTFDNYEQGQNGPLLGDNSGGSQLKTRKLRMRARKYPTAQTSLAETQTQTTSPIQHIKWSNAQVLFQFDQRFLDNAYRNKVRDEYSFQVLQNYYHAFDHYRTRTCIRFTTYWNAHTFFHPSRPNERSLVDDLGTTGAHVQIDNTRYVALHELGHVVGFSHTMSRQDRDDVVFFDESACRHYFSDEYEKSNGDPNGKEKFINDNLFQYRKASTLTTIDVGQYDLHSIMHYPFDQCMSLSRVLRERVAQAQIAAQSNGFTNQLSVEEMGLLNHLVAAENMRPLSAMNELSPQDVIGINQHYGCLQVTVKSLLLDRLSCVLNLHPASTDKDLRREVEWRFGLRDRSLEHRYITFNRVGYQATLDPRQTYILNQLVIGGPGQVNEFVVNF